jgi:hypothetical protein
LNQDELKNRKNEIDSLLGDVNKLLTDSNVIASNNYQRVIEALSELIKLKNSINTTPNVSDEIFPYSGECIDC